MNTQQHLWSMTAIISTLLICNMAVQIVNAQQEPISPKVLVAQEFRLVNAQNKTLATMVSGADNQPQITLFDGREHGSAEKMLELGLDGNGQPRFQFNDSTGKPRLKMFMVEYRGGDFSPVIALFNNNGQGRSSWRINANNQPDLILSGDSGARATLQNDSLSLHGNTLKEPAQTSLFAYDGRKPGLIFADANGKWLWTAPPKKTVKSSK